MSARSLDIASDPTVQRQLERFRARVLHAPRLRERRAEAVAGLLFVATAFALVISAGTEPVRPLVAAVLVLAYALALQIEFEVGAGYTAPTMLVLVPMLYLLPPAHVPLYVVAAHLFVYLLLAARGRRNVRRVFVVFAQGWYALGPAIVFAAAAPGPASWSDLAVLAAGFAAYVACDGAASLCVDHFGYREPLRPLLRSASWVYLVDALLLPVGLAVTIAAANSVAPLAALLPLFALLAIFAGERRRRLDHALELSQAYRGTAMLLGDVVEHDDGYTGEHSRDVVELCVEVGRRLGLDATSSRNLEFAALLHDVGKIAVPKAILNKPGALTDAEWEIMRRHTVEGQRMLERVGGVLTDVGAIVRSSHERWDGGGYPDGLAGDRIPIEARICAVCDAFSAMTTDRPYRRAMSVEQAVSELRAHAGTQFDPDVVDALTGAVADDAERTMPRQSVQSL